MAQLTEVTAGLAFPEGPIAMPDGSVILVEIERRTLSRVTPAGKVEVIATLGLAAVLASLWLIDDETPFPGPWTLLPNVGALLLILAGSNPANPVSRAFGWRPVTAIGDTSYSLYLWHWPVFAFYRYLGLWRESPQYCQAQRSSH